MSDLKTEIKKTLLNTAKYTSLDGIPSIVRAENKLIRIIWILCFCTTFAYFNVNLARYLIDYLNFDVTNLVVFERSPKIQFPTVTFCNKNPFKINSNDFILKDYFKQLSANQTNLDALKQNPDMLSQFKYIQYLSKISQFQASINETQRKKLSFSLDDMLLSCVYDNKICTVDDFEYFYSFTYGSCYKFNSGKDINGGTIPFKTSTTPGRRNALKLELFVGFPSVDLDFIRSNGAIIFVHNSTSIPLVEVEGVSVSTGFQTDIIINQVFVSKQSYPYSDCITDVKSMGSFNSESYKNTIKLINEYRQKYCLQLCYQKYLISRCGCYDRTIPYLDNYVPCNTPSSFYCQYYAQSNFTSSDSSISCFKECPQECNSIQYNLASTRSNFPSLLYGDLLLRYQQVKPVYSRNFTTYDEVKSSTLAVNIYYDDILLTYINELPSKTSDQVISDIGGMMSLCVGSSLLSLVEIAELIIELISVYFSYRKTSKKDTRTEKMIQYHGKY